MVSIDIRNIILPKRKPQRGEIDNWGKIRQDSLFGVLTSVWTDSPQQVYIVSHAGMYLANAHTHGDAERIWFDDDFSTGFPHRLRGQTVNDLVTGGDFSFIAHFNGNSWRHYDQFSGRIRTLGTAMRNNLLIAVGVDNNTQRAIIMEGVR